jgi:hypothetical protein
VFPDLIVPDLAWHLARFPGADDDSLLFTSPTGSPLRNSNFRRRVWLPALAVAGWPTFTFTIFAMLATSWRRPRARTCAS